MKYTRQAMILELIDKNVIETQDELSEKLKENGFIVTQATVSRDIKELKLIKVTDENGISRYRPMLEQNIALPGKLLSVFSHAFLSADYANNIAVVKTLPGMAQAVAAAIDSLKLEEVLGSIAGDDTILIACRTEKYAEEIVQMLAGLVNKGGAMLQTLNIQNIALIETLSMDFGEGMNCLTGETGAGKSIVIDAIGFVLGARASKEIIKTGKDNAVVSAIFFEQSEELAQRLSEMGVTPEEDGSLLLFRELNLAGRNICRINGVSVTLSMLRTIGEHLVDIHGQHENQSLMRGDSHLALLDAFGAEQLEAAKTSYRTAREEYETYRRLYKENRYSPEERAQKADLLVYQIQEIRNADLHPGEDETLSEQRIALENCEKISRALFEAQTAISQNERERSALEQVGEAARSLSDIARYKAQYAELSERVHEVFYNLEDISREIRDAQDDLYFTPEELTEIEDRLDLIDKLKRKYGNDIPTILAFADQAEEELASLEDAESAAQKLEGKLSTAFGRLKTISREISEIRHAVAENLTSLIQQELEDLEMPGASFAVSFQDMTPEQAENSDVWPSFGESGCDRAEFLISANRGEPLKPLAKIASGGELSRIMLAIKKILAHVDHISTLIFDEIDIGISGRAARRVGEKMRRIASDHQVICVTHSPQIAVLAHTNILIGKHMDEHKTEIACDLLNKDGKIREIARLLDGHPDSEITLRHAEEMVAQAESDVF